MPAFGGSKAADIYIYIYIWERHVAANRYQGLHYMLLHYIQTYLHGQEDPIYYTWELSIFLDIKVCGFNCVCIYNTVMASWSDICDIEI